MTSNPVLPGAKRRQLGKRPKFRADLLEQNGALAGSRTRASGTRIDFSPVSRAATLR
jgi:hypothetical protein